MVYQELKPDFKRCCTVRHSVFKRQVPCAITIKWTYLTTTSQIMCYATIDLGSGVKLYNIKIYIKLRYYLMNQTRRNLVIKHMQFETVGI
jgi:hypothetical protein